MITVLSRKFLSQIANGEDFTAQPSDYSTNLTGSVMERIRAVLEIQLEVVSESSGSGGEYVISGSDTITRQDSSDWSDDGWNVGDAFDFASASPACTFNGTIVSINGAVLTFSVNSGAAADDTYDAATMEITSDYLAAVWQFGLPENSDNTDNYINAVDGSEQLYTVTGITSSFKTMNPAPGAKSWITGSAQIKRGALAAGKATYTIQQDFIITPYYLAELEQNLLDGTSPEDWFEGTNSLKFTWSLELRRALSDPNLQHSASENDQIGSVGWYGENYDGFVNNYTLSDVTFQDADTGDVVTGIQIDRKTRITATITADGLFSVESRIGAYFSAALAPEDYAANTTPFTDLWMYDNYVRTVDNEYTGLSGVIKRFDTTLVSADEVTVSIDVEFTASQQAALSEGQRYIVAFQAADHSLNRPDSDVVMLLADFGQFVKNNDVSGLLEYTSLDFIYHPQDESDLGASSVRGWVEDGILARCRFALDVSIPARLKQLIFKFLARNTAGNEFTIQQYAFDLSSGLLQPIGGGLFKQAFNLDTTRGFPLVSGDFFNRVRLAEYVDIPGYRYGEYEQSALSVTVTFDGVLTLDYVLVWDDNDGMGLVISGETENGFTSGSGGTGGIVSYFALKTGIGVNGIRGGVQAITAGTNLITFATFGTTDYTVFCFDEAGNALVLTSLNDSRTATSFEVEAGLSGTLRWVAVRNAGLQDFRSGTASIGIGSTPVSFSSTFGTTDYTLLILDLENVGNIYGRVKADDGFNISSGVETTINYIAIRN